MSECPYRNLLDPSLYASEDHHQVMLQIRQQGGPITWIEDPVNGVPYWAVMGRDLVDYMCKNPQIYSSYEQSCLPNEWSEDELVTQRLMMVNMDPPDHLKYRRIARNAFTPSAVNSYEASFRSHAKQIIDRVAAKGECEFVTEVAAELPLIAILELCGVPIEERDRFFRWTNDMFFKDDESMGDGTTDGLTRAMEAAANMFGYAESLAMRHRETPLNNIIGALLDGTVDGESLTDEEFQLFFVMLVAAGNESTRSMISHGMRLLMEHPDQLAQLVNDHGLIEGAVEEILRYNPAFNCMRRTATMDTELGGQQVRKGDKLVMFWHGVNRDDTVFDAPMDFDINRSNSVPNLHSQHRAFGVGQHFCIGAHLARLEIRIMFEELLPRLRDPEFNGEVEYVKDFYVNGIKSMPIKYTAENR